MSIETVVDIKKFDSIQKLLRVTSWVKRFVNNLKKKVLKKETLKKPFVDSNELYMSQLQWISENQRSFDKRKLQVVRKALNFFVTKMSYLEVKGGLIFQLEQHYLRYVKTSKFPFRTIGTPMSSSK